MTFMEKFEVHDYGHALDILENSFPKEFQEIVDTLMNLYIPDRFIIEAGGNKTEIAKMFDDLLFPKGWSEMRISGDLVIHKYIRSKRSGAEARVGESVIEGYIDGHNIDFVKGRVAFDLEWNSKDQTFDRDLLAMRTYFDAGVIDVGIIVTRSADLNILFDELGLKAKYGASTTWMGKLIPRLDSRRNGGCPILAVGIKRDSIVRMDRFR